MWYHHLWSLLTERPLVWQLGLSLLAAQCLLGVLFANVLPKGPWTDDPSFTAHQVLCIPLMAYLTYQGCVEWFGQHDNASILSTNTPFDRILGLPHPEPDLSLIVFTMMIFWDIPTGLLTPSLRQAPMVAHHVAMLLTAMLALGVWSDGHGLLGYYAAYYFGVIEVSSIPLVVVDLFHPKRASWHAYLKRAPRALQVANEVNRICFAILFLLVRALSFPYVSIGMVLPDVWHVVSLEERRGVSSTPLLAMAALNVFFSCLQCYWGILVARQVVKALCGSNNNKNNKPSSTTSTNEDAKPKRD